jgi:hypothetical protein
MVLFGQFVVRLLYIVLGCLFIELEYFVVVFASIKVLGLVKILVVNFVVDGLESLLGFDELVQHFLLVFECKIYIASCYILVSNFPFFTIINFTFF